jgi:hypothetical protein
VVLLSDSDADEPSGSGANLAPPSFFVGGVPVPQGGVHLSVSGGKWVGSEAIGNRAHVCADNIEVDLAGGGSSVASYEDVSKVELMICGDAATLILSMGRRKRIRLEFFWETTVLGALRETWRESPHMSTLLKEDEGRRKEDDNPAARALDVQNGSTMCVYRPDGAGPRSAITVSWHDYELLKPEEYLNDTVIDFYMKLLETNDLLLTAEQRSRCCFLSSFFWKLLCRVDRDGDYKPVHKWLRGRDLLGKDFIFIPICEGLHWSLAVLTYPRHIGLQPEITEGKQTAVLYLDSLGRNRHPPL